MYRIGENRNDAFNREAIRDEGSLRRKYNLPVMVGAYCPICHYFNFLVCKSKNGRKICASCCEEENK